MKQYESFTIGNIVFHDQTSYSQSHRGAERAPKVWMARISAGAVHIRLCISRASGVWVFCTYGSFVTEFGPVRDIGIEQIQEAAAHALEIAEQRLRTAAETIKLSIQ